MENRLRLGNITVDVIRKDIKNLHLSVHPPTGRVRISAPERMGLETIRVFAVSKLGWIKKQQKKLREQERESPREYVDRESHYVWGKRYLIKVVESERAPVVELKPRQLLLRVRPGTSRDRKKEIVAEWYRRQIKSVVPSIISRWESLIGVQVERIFVRQMKTKWGSCNPRSNSIRVNTHLAKKPVECLEYIVVHEMVHLLEPKHNTRFIVLMDRFLPQWRSYRDQLNQLPISQEEWGY